MEKLYLFFLLIFLINLSSSVCLEGQININTASLEELDRLDGIGETIAQYIIDARPFSSIEDLVNVNRIGEVTLEKIINQSLACVEEENFIEETPNESFEETSNFEDTYANEENNVENISFQISEIKSNSSLVSNYSLSLQPKVIDLNTQNIKTEKSTEKIQIKDYSKYLILIFCLLLLFLYLIKPKERKNEWTG